ncbi:hypothetical protein C8F04DRAFT_1193106 [Mycena alexandri]|uniref:Uncharacterized protein n=1 Tax=Mycena alexandri TaxID=1745969 RepID=A0AAD6WQX7_9AGAR|nr:hypothetical protein C8F04DRAFT_1193106 [Mycena alexandri]
MASAARAKIGLLDLTAPGEKKQRAREVAPTYEGTSGTASRSRRDVGRISLPPISRPDPTDSTERRMKVTSARTEPAYNMRRVRLQNADCLTPTTQTRTNGHDAPAPAHSPHRRRREKKRKSRLPSFLGKKIRRRWRKYGANEDEGETSKEREQTPGGMTSAQITSGSPPPPPACPHPAPRAQKPALRTPRKKNKTRLKTKKLLTPNPPQRHRQQALPRPEDTPPPRVARPT